MSNFKNVLKVYTMMCAFDTDDHALLNTLRNATEAEIELLVQAVGPVKRTTAKRTRKSSKSPRAASLAGAIGGTAKTLTEIQAGLCTFTYNDSSICEQGVGSPVHNPNGGYAGYHPFQPAVAQAAAGSE